MESGHNGVHGVSVARLVEEDLKHARVHVAHEAARAAVLSISSVRPQAAQVNDLANPFHYKTDSAFIDACFNRPDRDWNGVEYRISEPYNFD